MRDTIKGACIGGLVAAFTTVLLAQTWTITAHVGNGRSADRR